MISFKIMYREILDKFCKNRGLKLLIETSKGSKYYHVIILGRYEQPTWVCLGSVSDESIVYAPKHLLQFFSAGENGLSGEEAACQAAILFIFEASSIVYRTTSERWKRIDVSNITTIEELEIYSDLFQDHV